LTPNIRRFCSVFRAARAARCEDLSSPHRADRFAIGVARNSSTPHWPTPYDTRHGRWAARSRSIAQRWPTRRWKSSKRIFFLAFRTTPSTSSSTRRVWCIRWSSSWTEACWPRWVCRRWSFPCCTRSPIRSVSRNRRSRRSIPWLPRPSRSSACGWMTFRRCDSVSRRDEPEVRRRPFSTRPTKKQLRCSSTVRFHSWTFPGRFRERWTGSADYLVPPERRLFKQ
jgi:hypothetical protein